MKLTAYGKNRYIVSVGNSAELSKKIDYLFSNVELINSMTVENIRKISNYTIENMAKRHYEISCILKI